MKSNSKFILVAAIALVAFQSCQSPKNIVKLQPEKENGKWRYGQQFIADSLNGIIYEVGYEQLRDNRYWFDISVTNRSNMPILIDPAQFSFQPFDAMENRLTAEKVNAIDPETEIMELEKQLAKTEAREANHIGLSLLAASVDLASGIAAATDDNPYNNNHRTHLYHDVQLAKAENAFEAQSLEEVMNAWKNSTIRKTTLEPNYTIKGKAFFPVFRDAAYIKLYLPVDDQEIVMNFKQVQYPVK